MSKNADGEGLKLGRVVDTKILPIVWVFQHQFRLLLCHPFHNALFTHVISQSSKMITIQISVRMKALALKGLCDSPKQSKIVFKICVLPFVC